MPIRVGDLRQSPRSNYTPLALCFEYEMPQVSGQMHCIGERNLDRRHTLAHLPLHEHIYTGGKWGDFVDVLKCYCQ